MPPLYYVLTLGYCIAIFSASHVPGSQLPDMYFAHQDKVYHFIVFGGLTAAISMGMHRSSHAYTRRQHFLIPVLFTALYALTDEVHQIFVLHRSFDLLDWAADCAGALAAQVVLLGGVWRTQSTGSKPYGQPEQDGDQG